MMTGRVRTRPVGTITRGTTNPNRLRRCDRWMLHELCPILRARDTAPLVVDLGYGASPVTTVEWSDRLRQHVREDVVVVGIEIDPERVADAQPLTRPGLSFMRGGFVLAGQAPALVRAFNVLRQYAESEVQPAWSTILTHMDPRGILVEGTCDEIGRRATWITAYAEDQRPDGRITPRTLTLSTHLASLEAPSELAERLPKCLIHRHVPGERVHALFGALDRAWERSVAMAPFGPRQRWLTAMTAAASA